MYFFSYGELGKNDFGFNIFIAHVGNFCGPIFELLEDETWYHAALLSSLCWSYLKGLTPDTF